MDRSIKEKKIFITGCSSGIGLALVKGLSARGHQVMASCRSEKDVARLVDMGYSAVQMDVDDSASIATAFNHLDTRFSGQLDVLINNAGYGQSGALEDVSRTVMRAQFETNVFGMLEVTQRAIPWMRQQKSGRIINLSSVLGVISLPFRGAYNASKYAVEGLSDTLRLELQGVGISVIVVEPGPIDSSFRDTAVDKSLQSIDMKNSAFSQQYQSILRSFKQKKLESSMTQPPEAVLKKIIHAVESSRPRPKYAVTLPAHALIFARRLLSARLLNALLARISKSELS